MLDLNQQPSPFETWSPGFTPVCHAPCFGTSEISLLLPPAAVDFFAVEQPFSPVNYEGNVGESRMQEIQKKTCTNVHAFFVAPCVGLEPTTLRLTAECSTAELSRNKIRQLPILPARLQTSTFGAIELNFCVRNENRWTSTLSSPQWLYNRLSRIIYLLNCNLID